MCWKCHSFPGSPASPSLSALQHRQWEALTKQAPLPSCPRAPLGPYIPSLPGSSCAARWRISKAPWQQPELVIGSLSCEAFPFQMSILYLTIASLQGSKTQVKPLLLPESCLLRWSQTESGSLHVGSLYHRLSSETQPVSFWVALLAYVCVFTSNQTSLSQSFLLRRLTCWTSVQFGTPGELHKFQVIFF